MAHSKSALKRWRQNEAHRDRNKPVRSAARSAVRKAHSELDAGGGANADAAIHDAVRILDRASKRRVIHPNAASRYKSRLMRHRNRVAPSTRVPGVATKGSGATPRRRAPAKPRGTATKSRSSKPKG